MARPLHETHQVPTLSESLRSRCPALASMLLMGGAGRCDPQSGPSPQRSLHFTQNSRLCFLKARPSCILQFCITLHGITGVAGGAGRHVRRGVAEALRRRTASASMTSSTV